jgi:hypothetical protein
VTVVKSHLVVSAEFSIKLPGGGEVILGSVVLVPG